MEVPNAVTYRPRKERVEALAAIIAAMMADGEQDPEAIARTSLMWVHEQGQQGTRLAEEHEPMTADEVLLRIRSLLDDGSAVRQREEIEDLKKRLSEAEEWALKAETRAEQARATLKAFTDLAHELATDEERKGA